MKIKYVLAIGIALIATVALLGPRVDMNISLDDLTLTDNLDPVSYTHLTLPTNREV